MAMVAETRRDEVTIGFLESFGEAFYRHDVDAILEHMTDDVRFDVSVGPEVWGQRHEGKAAVRQGVLAVFAAVPDGQWEEGRHFVAGDRGVSEWVFRGTAPDGRTSRDGPRTGAAFYSPGTALSRTGRRFVS